MRTDHRPTDRTNEATDWAATGTDRPKEASQTKDSFGELARPACRGQPAGPTHPASPAQPEQTNSRGYCKLDADDRFTCMFVQLVGAVTTFSPRGEKLQRRNYRQLSVMYVAVRRLAASFLISSSASQAAAYIPARAAGPRHEVHQKHAPFNEARKFLPAVEFVSRKTCADASVQVLGRAGT